MISKKQHRFLIGIVFSILSFLVYSQASANEIYTYPFGQQESNLSSNTNYYFGFPIGTRPSTASTSYSRRLPINQTGTLTSIEFRSGSFTTVSSGEDSTLILRVNGTTNYVLTTAFETNTNNTQYNATLNIPIIAGDFVEFVLQTPTFATPPVSWVPGGQLYLTKTTNSTTTSSTTISQGLQQTNEILYLIALILGIMACIGIVNHLRKLYHGL